MKTRQCPVCGEEILAAAKKCKYCGEWLAKSQKDLTMGEMAVPEIQEVALPNYSILVVVCWCAIFFGIISGIHDMEINRMSGRYGFLVQLANVIPEWLAILCGGASWIYILTGLRQHCIALGRSKGGLLLAVICLAVATYFILLISSFVPDNFEDEGSEGLATLLFLPAFLLLIAHLIMQFIAGIKLRDILYENKWVGTMFILAGIIPFLLLVLSLGLTGEYVWWAIFGETLANVILLITLNDFFKSHLNE